ncbi:MAG: exosortase/archaeosortase family protein [Myxococcota bacterium]|nr:exosortase/archaeosortase family protein [Myxococcota bacterium]
MSMFDDRSKAEGAQKDLRRGLSWGDWAIVGALAIVAIPGWQAMAGVWSAADHYSHGYAIPLMAVWAASAKRRILPGLSSHRDFRGILLLVGVLLVYGLGLAADLVWLSGLGVVGLVAGGVLYLKGSAWLRELAFPIAYLLFMVPLPDSWLAPVIVRLQLLVSAIGAGLLHFFGEPVLRVGNVLQLPGGEELFVAEACSGITSLITLVPIGVFLAYFTETGFLRRALLVSTVVPVALGANLVRVLITVIVAERVGARVATESSLHEWLGLATYVVACLIVLGTGRVLRRWWPVSKTLGVR